jgi:hypothetical protein
MTLLGSGAKLQIQTYNLDGIPGPMATIRRDPHLQLWLDSDQIVATGMWGVKVALTTTGRIVLVDRSAFELATQRSLISE